MKGMRGVLEFTCEGQEVGVGASPMQHEFVEPIMDIITRGLNMGIGGRDLTSIARDKIDINAILTQKCIENKCCPELNMILDEINNPRQGVDEESVRFSDFATSIAIRYLSEEIGPNKADGNSYGFHLLDDFLDKTDDGGVHVTIMSETATHRNGETETIHSRLKHEFRSLLGFTEKFNFMGHLLSDDVTHFHYEVDKNFDE